MQSVYERCWDLGVKSSVLNQISENKDLNQITIFSAKSLPETVESFSKKRSNFDLNFSGDRDLPNTGFYRNFIFKINI